MNKIIASHLDDLNYNILDLRVFVLLLRLVRDYSERISASFDDDIRNAAEDFVVGLIGQLVDDLSVNWNNFSDVLSSGELLKEKQ